MAFSKGSTIVPAMKPPSEPPRGPVESSEYCLASPAKSPPASTLARTSFARAIASSRDRVTFGSALSEPAYATRMWLAAMRALVAAGTRGPATGAAIALIGAAGVAGGGSTGGSVGVSSPEQAASSTTTAKARGKRIIRRGPRRRGAPAWSCRTRS